MLGLNEKSHSMLFWSILVQRNDQDGTRAEHSLSRVIIVAMLSPQLLIPPHSVQAEASGGTVDHETSKGGPAKL